MNDSKNTSLWYFPVDNFETTVSVRVLFVCLGTISSICSCLAFVVLHKTRRIPESAMFLSSALMMFDCLFITTSTVRKFITDPLYNTTTNSVSNAFLQLGFITVGMMSVERFYVFYRPMSYMRHFRKRVLRKVAYLIWIITVSVFLCVRYGACFSKFRTMLVFEQPGLCNSIVTIHYSLVVALVLCTSIPCYCYVYRIVKQQATRDGNMLSFYSAAIILRSYKSTSLVLVFFIVTFCSSVAYALLIICIRHVGMEIKDIRLALEIISIINCLLDPFLYVLWFKESQMELLKLFSCFSSVLKIKAEDMRYEVYNIVVAETKPVDTNNDKAIKHSDWF